VYPTRTRIFELLASSDRSVEELQGPLGLDHPLVSQQLSVLRSKQIVGVRRRGTTIRYALSDLLIQEMLWIARAILDNHMLGTRRCYANCEPSTGRATASHDGPTRALGRTYMGRSCSEEVEAMGELARMVTGLGLSRVVYLLAEFADEQRDLALADADTLKAKKWAHDGKVLGGAAMSVLE
jgi:Bacterial regulatory protein, arsR family